ncbi:hypothetical protein M404DRAFT_29507 [Pisolithus tinctorius Marx 270]|uniref:Uncharacterized protein n=1 Tax=Pisolithus tinctorius Marx 270 TaxID=870435 RepID=A0A0C3NZM1_PISTI|nr:hypothetical protein M404DRAFT_29507 [Pisolithus tinctorius Marx 270]
MSAGHAPHLSKLVCAATPDLIKAEKTTLRAKFVAASVALVAEVKCLPDDKEELWEEKVMWMHRWEQRTGEVFPLVEHRQELGIDTKIDTADGPAVAEANEAYKKWVAKEIVCGRTDKDMWMEEAVAQAVIEQGASAEVPAATEKMSHVEVVSCPVQKGCEKLNKSMGKKMQTGMVTVQSAKAAAKDDKDNDKVEVVESHMHRKGKAPVRNWLNAKVTADLSQSLRLLQAKAMESQAAYLLLQVHVDQLAEALEKIGVE